MCTVSFAIENPSSIVFELIIQVDGEVDMFGDDQVNIREPQPIQPENCDKSCLKRLQEFYPDTRAPRHDTFEIGLVLAGAVSAGAYTAGVMDFLIEALDEWHLHRQANPDIPQHNVELRIITGASAGGMNGAIAASACRYMFPPITENNASSCGSKNPFFNAWVKCIDITRLLDSSDLKSATSLHSLLNSKRLDEIALNIVETKGNGAANSYTRAWLADPFKLLLSVTNLRGVPYEVRFAGNTGYNHEMIMHRDHIGFMVPVFKNVSTAPPDLVPLTIPNTSKDPSWQMLAVASLATGAFPLVLGSRHLSRPRSDYDYRFVFPYSPGGLVYSRPRIDSSDTYNFIGVDGGTMNNEPFNLAHIELAGLKGKNPRTGDKAHRAIIMVDPFTEPRSNNSEQDDSLIGVGKALASAFKAQTRFNQFDLTLAEAVDVYSRFMIAPSRLGIKGSRAIASGGMGGFLGFFCEEYRLHDYMLGRRNCHFFLRDWFVLPSNNPLFSNWPEAAFNNSQFKSSNTARTGHHQIIPLVGSAALNQKLPAWPEGKFSGYESVRDKVEARLDAAYPHIRTTIHTAASSESAFLSWICRPIVNLVTLLIWRFWVRSKILKYFKSKINSGLDEIDKS